MEELSTSSIKEGRFLWLPKSSPGSFDPPNQSVYIRLETAHRLENPGTEPLVLIKVQTGDYLGEDDIVRLADDSWRVSRK